MSTYINEAHRERQATKIIGFIALDVTRKRIVTLVSCQQR